MTLEEAKKKIKAQANAEWEEFKKTGSMLCQGFALGADDALETLDKAESSRNPEQLTLTELAQELRKLLPRTRYVTVGDNPKASIVGDKIVSIFYERDGRKPKPEYNKDSMRPNTWGVKHPKIEVYGKPFYVPGFYQFYVHEVADLGLSEYKDADGNIDYSKCIVEVSDES